MLRERNEIIQFTRDDIERICRHLAQQQIIGHLFIGKLGAQKVTWTQDGLEVVTSYMEGSYDDLPALAHKKKK